MIFKGSRHLERIHQKRERIHIEKKVLNTPFTVHPVSTKTRALFFKPWWQQINNIPFFSSQKLQQWNFPSSFLSPYNNINNQPYKNTHPIPQITLKPPKFTTFHNSSPQKMVEFHLFTPFTWVLLLLLLHVLFLNHVGAQSSMEPVPTYISRHNWEPSFAITVGAIICALLFMGIISIYIRNCAESHFIITTNRTNPSATTTKCSCSQGINKELLNTFPTFFYSTIKDLKTGKGPLECAVCLTDFKDHDTLRLLPKCNHVFHPQCIDSWLASHVTCPVCRANLNQDSCQVAMMIPTHLGNDQMGEESCETRPQTQPEKDQNTNQVVVESKGEGSSSDDGDVSRWKLLRSNSTGHSLVEPVKCVERYTLRLPEDVRRYVLVNHGKIVQRSLSSSNNNNNNNNMVKGLCWSESEGNNGEGVRVERCVLCAPPFVALSGWGISSNIFSALCFAPSLSTSRSF